MPRPIPWIRQVAVDVHPTALAGEPVHQGPLLPGEGGREGQASSAVRCHPRRKPRHHSWHGGPALLQVGCGGRVLAGDVANGGGPHGAWVRTGQALQRGGSDTAHAAWPPHRTRCRAMPPDWSGVAGTGGSAVIRVGLLLGCTQAAGRVSWRGHLALVFDGAGRHGRPCVPRCPEKTPLPPGHSPHPGAPPAVCRKPGLQDRRSGMAGWSSAAAVVPFVGPCFQRPLFLPPILLRCFCRWSARQRLHGDRRKPRAQKMPAQARPAMVYWY